jgi:hypothetical protein
MTLISEWKSRADGVIKGNTLHTVVAAPLEALRSARTNAVANKYRKAKLKFASEHENGPRRENRKRSKSKQNGCVYRILTYVQSEAILKKLLLMWKRLAGKVSLKYLKMRSCFRTRPLLGSPQSGFGFRHRL